ncbi:uncharacterized protein LOC126243001 [Schistocerca nitens]|uniref:uncharacterized protein LOC126243001 n=1 Tax=Schistocerca nitens TaxID=7011 RepID=UPI002117C8E1|nr:uncharacterized protein LOC126243001 [Schistocerca nitens]
MAEAILLQQEHTSEKLMEEALHIHRIIPQRSIDEIYSSLETFCDDPKRVKKVVLKFLGHVKEDSATADDAIEELSKRPKERNYDDEHNQPSTSGIPSEIPVTSDANGDNGTKPLTTRDITVDVDVSAHSDSLPAESDKCVIADEASTSFSDPTVPGRAGNGNHNNMFDRVLQADLTLPDVNGVDGESKQAYYNTLMKIFPDAQKDFVKGICDKCSQDANWLSNATSNLLENGYPRAADNSEQEVELVANQELSGRIDKNDCNLLTITADNSEQEVELAANQKLSGRTEENYCNLLAIFPNADPTYIRETCEQIADDEDAMKKFVNDTLESGKYPTLAEYEEQMKVVEIREKYLKNFKIEEFLEIFPDPFKYFFEEKKNDKTNSELSLNYLKSHYKETCTAVLQECLMKNEYSLTKSCAELDKCQNFTKSSHGEHEIQYSENDVKDISFMQENVQGLSKKYEQLDVFVNETMPDVLGISEHWLSDAKLELFKPLNMVLANKFCRSTIRGGVYQYQECFNLLSPFPVAFIENRQDIETYLNEKELKRVESLRKAKENNELLECGCCYDNEVLAEDVVTCAEGDIFCKTCLQKYAENQIGDGKTVFTCLSNCTAEFSLKMLQRVLKPSVFSKMLQRKQMEEIKSAAIRGLEVCPFCDFASIPPEEDKVFCCLNPECMKESCRKCKELNHIPLRCEEVEKPEEVKIRTYIEDRMTEALIRTCWRCGKNFIKIDGCNKMTCTCGALMCYICRKPVNGYDHFNEEGGTNYHKCPLFSKNDDLHVKAVEEAATKARNETLAKNPNIQLKHDPTLILPERTQEDVPGQPNVHFM